MGGKDLPMVAVIMAGGAGTRFWPLSTAEKPKQFLKLFDNRSLLQNTYDRLKGIVPDHGIMVLTNRNFMDVVRKQLPDLLPENLIAEPIRRDTAATVCLGALISKKRFGNPVIITLPADHLIEPVDLFQQDVLSAVRSAVKTGALYTFGIKPVYPATEYGYIELGEKIVGREGVEYFQLHSFKEKPERQTARLYVESGNYLWNSGIFVWTAEAIIGEIRAYLPIHLHNFSRAVEYEGTPEWDVALQNAFEQITSISIDYGVMEKTKKFHCVVGNFSWQDAGGWLAIRKHLKKSGESNYCRGRTHTLDASGNIVFCEDREEIAVLVGVKDLVVVRVGNKTLIAKKNRLNDVKAVVESME